MHPALLPVMRLSFISLIFLAFTVAAQHRSDLFEKAPPEVDQAVAVFLDL